MKISDSQGHPNKRTTHQSHHPQIMSEHFRVTFNTKVPASSVENLGPCLRDDHWCTWCSKPFVQRRQHVWRRLRDNAWSFVRRRGTTAQVRESRTCLHCIKLPKMSELPKMYSISQRHGLPSDFITFSQSSAREPLVIKFGLPACELAGERDQTPPHVWITYLPASSLASETKPPLVNKIF